MKHPFTQRQRCLSCLLGVILGGAGMWSLKSQRKSATGAPSRVEATLSHESLAPDFKSLDFISQLRLLAKLRPDQLARTNLQAPADTILGQAVQLATLQGMGDHALLMASVDARLSLALRKAALTTAAEHDPSAAAAFICQRPESDWQRDLDAGDVLLMLFPHNAATALKFLDALTARADCYNPAGLLGAYAQQNFPDAYARLQLIQNAETLAASSFWNSFAMVDPAAAVAALQQKGGDLEQVFSWWALDDFDGAMAWMRAQPPRVQKRCASDAINALVQNAPDQVLPFLQEFPQLEDNYVLHDYLSGMYADGYESLLRAARSTDSESLRASALAVVLNSDTAQSAHDCTAVLTALYPDGIPEATLRDLSYDYESLRGDVPTLWAKLQAIPERMREQILDEVFQAMAAQDPVAASERWQQLPDGPSKTAALDGLIWQWAQASDAAGAAFLGTLPPDLQSLGLGAWVSGRVTHDPEGAFQAVEQAPTNMQALRGDNLMLLVAIDPVRTINLLSEVGPQVFPMQGTPGFKQMATKVLAALPQSKLTGPQQEALRAYLTRE